MGTIAGNIIDILGGGQFIINNQVHDIKADINSIQFKFNGCFTANTCVIKYSPFKHYKIEFWNIQLPKLASQVYVNVGVKEHCLRSLFESFTGLRG